MQQLELSAWKVNQIMSISRWKSSNGSSEQSEFPVSFYGLKSPTQSGPIPDYPSLLLICFRHTSMDQPQSPSPSCLPRMLSFRIWPFHHSNLSPDITAQADLLGISKFNPPHWSASILVSCLWSTYWYLKISYLM